MPDLSNIRDYLGWIIGRRVVDVTAGDPPGLPDNDDDAHFVVLHFDNGGTLDVPIGDEGFSYNNPAAAAADRGELCEDCQGWQPAYHSSTEEARLKETTRAFLQRQDEVSAILRAKGYPIVGHEIGEDSTSGTSRRERGAERLTQVDPRDAPDGPGFSRNTLDPSAPRGELPRAAHVFPCALDDLRIARISDYPQSWKPANPHYVKSHINAPGTVRAWFRQMRAADFDRSLVATRICEFKGWTLFDTQQVVDRETAAHYLGPCPRCGGSRRVVPAPLSYIGPSSGSVLYHYAHLLEADRRYGHPSHRVAMCDSCQHGEIRP